MIKFGPEDIVSEWDLKSKINKVHEYLFYNATLETQCTKYSEERKEFIDAESEEDRLEELADMFICACGIKRFSYNIGKDLCDSILKNYNFDKNKILLAVCDKMNILQHREWEENNGYYKHKVFDIDEQTGKSERVSKTNSKK